VDILGANSNPQGTICQITTWHVEFLLLQCVIHNKIWSRVYYIPYTHTILPFLVHHHSIFVVVITNILCYHNTSIGNITYFPWIKHQRTPLLYLRPLCLLCCKLFNSFHKFNLKLTLVFLYQEQCNLLPSQKVPMLLPSLEKLSSRTGWKRIMPLIPQIN